MLKWLLFNCFEDEKEENNFEQQQLHLVDEEEISMDISIYKLMNESYNVIDLKLVDLQNTINELKKNMEHEKQQNISLNKNIELLQNDIQELKQYQKEQNLLLNKDIASLDNDIQEFKQYQIEQNYIRKERNALSKNYQDIKKPFKISYELAKFLGKPFGTEMARTDITTEINFYIRDHMLQDKDNARNINPDTKLATLFKLKDTDKLTYFNLQRYIDPHMIYQ